MRDRVLIPERDVESFLAATELEALAREVVDQPPEVIDWLKKAFGEVTIDFLLN